MVVHHAIEVGLIWAKIKRTVYWANQCNDDAT